VKYQRVDLEHKADESQDIARWETTRVIDDPAEHERATKARNKASAAIRRVCSVTSFGLLCPLSQEGALDAAIVEARGIVDEFNRSASWTRIAIFALKGRIAGTDEEAARAITQEMASLVQAMNEGIDKLDPEAIREAATKAREMAMMLGDAEEAKAADAIDAARKAARLITKRVKEGEDKAIILADIQRGALEKARIAFLDMSGDAGTTGEAMPAVAVQRFADIDVGEGQ
jgi:hypothetical protein